MLPNNFRLFQDTEDKLKKLKTKTGITPNISARIAFFCSIEHGY
ncbi:DndE family protein, partial [Oleiphilus sp. HI0117]